MIRYAIVFALVLSACGYSAKDNELVAQVKKVVKNTPILCGDYDEVDVSLGIVRGGTGSLSKEDVVFYSLPEHIKMLKQAAEGGQIVKLTYDIRRVTWCVPDHWITGVSLLADAPTAEASK